MCSAGGGIVTRQILSILSGTLSSVCCFNRFASHFSTRGNTEVGAVGVTFAIRIRGARNAWLSGVSRENRQGGDISRERVGVGRLS